MLLVLSAILLALGGAYERALSYCVFLGGTWLPFLIGSFVPSRFLDYEMIPYNLLDRQISTAISPRILPDVSAQIFLTKYGYFVSLVPGWLRFQLWIFVNERLAKGYAHVFAILLDVIGAATIVGCVVFVLGAFGLSIINFSVWCDRKLTGAKRRGLPLAAFLIYLSGTTVAFIGKSISFFG